MQLQWQWQMEFDSFVLVIVCVWANSAYGYFLFHFCFVFAYHGRMQNGNGALIYLHDLSPACCCWWCWWCCCCWWSFPIFTIISLPTLLLHEDKDSIDNSKASCNAAADDDDVGDGNCCGCDAWSCFWFLPQTFNGFCPFVGSISANNTDILVDDRFFFVCLFFSLSRSLLSVSKSGFRFLFTRSLSIIMRLNFIRFAELSVS